MPNPKSSTVTSSPEIYGVWSDEIRRRLDPMYFHPARLEAINAVRKAKAKPEPLSDVAEFRRDQVTEIPAGTTYIGLENIASNTGEYMETDEKENISSAFVFKKGDVLFPKLRPYLNKVYYAEFNGVCSTEFHVLKAVKCLPEYLFVFLSTSIVVKQTSRLMTGNTLPRLQTEDVEELLIPIPSAAQQKKVVALMWDALGKKKKMEAEIKKVLASVDGYVLGELGIGAMGGVSSSKTFEVWSDEIHNRFDPIFLRNMDTLKKFKSKFASTTLSKLLKNPPQYGANVRAMEGDAGNDVRYIRITDIDAYGNLRDESWKTAEKVEDRYLLKENDLLFARSGATAGKALIYKSVYGKALFAGYMIKMELDEKKVEPEYVFAFTRTAWYELWVKTIQRAAGQPNINAEEFGSLALPLPPLAVQRKIVAGVRAITKKMRDLRIAANDLVEQAQTKATKMILA